MKKIVKEIVEWLIAMTPVIILGVLLQGLMALYFYRENYNVYNGNTRLCDIHYFILKGEQKYGKGIYRFQGEL